MCAHPITGQHVRAGSPAGRQPHLRAGNAAELAKELVLQGREGLRGPAVSEALRGHCGSGLEGLVLGKQAPAAADLG